MNTISSYLRLVKVFCLLLISYGTITAQVVSYDCLGAAYRTNQFIVKFKPGISKHDKQIIRDKVDAVLIKQCMCITNDLELWDVTNSPGITPEEKQNSMSSTIDIESVDFNYIINFQPHSTIVGTPMIPLRGKSTNQVKVAIIDTGIDRDHSFFTGTKSTFYINTAEDIGTPNTDDDSNCLIDDVYGYDFGNDDGSPLEKQLDHGTHLVGIADQTSNGSLEIIDLKTFIPQYEENTLFNATCATYYSIYAEAKVINMSWGWYGLPALCLKKAIKLAGDKNCALVVCSAGNEAQSVDVIPHYPSGYPLKNIMEVTALGPNKTIASYASYGNEVDIAVRGKWVSMITHDRTATKEGTSMAAAAITGLAATLYAKNSAATYHEVKRCILNTALTEPSWPKGLVKDNKFYDFSHTSVQIATQCAGVSLNKPCIDKYITCDNNVKSICKVIDGNPNHPLYHEDCDNGGISNHLECNYGGNPHSPCDDCTIALNLDICALISGDPDHPLAKKDCDNGGAINYFECKVGTDPTNGKDDKCYKCRTANEEDTSSEFKVFPNPFAQAVSITLNLEEDSPVSIQIVDISGKRVFSYQNDFQVGQHTVEWNGASVPSGVYIVHIETNTSHHTSRIIK